MPTNSEIIAIGPYTGDLAPYMENVEECYVNVPDGAMVITSLFGAAPTTDTSRLLALMFGVVDDVSDDISDASRHFIGEDPYINEDALVEYCGRAGEPIETARAAIMAFVANGFTFFFRY